MALICNRPTCIYVYIHRYIDTYIFVVVNSDALAQASDIRIERRQFVTQVLRHQIASRLNARWQTDWAIEDQTKKKTWSRQPAPMINEHSSHSTPLLVGFRTWLWRYTCLWLLIPMLWYREPIFESKGDNLSSSAEYRFEPWKSGTPNRQQTECPNRLSYRGSSENLELESPSLWWASIQPTIFQDSLEVGHCNNFGFVTMVEQESRACYISLIFFKETKLSLRFYPIFIITLGKISGFRSS